MEDFVITRVKNWKDMENFIFCLFFSLHMYNNNTNSLITADAHLMEKKGYYVQFVSLIDLINSSKNLAFIYLFFV